MCCCFSDESRQAGIGSEAAEPEQEFAPDVTKAVSKETCLSGAGRPRNVAGCPDPAPSAISRRAPRSVEAGPLVAEGRVAKLDKAVAFMEGTLMDEAGNLLVRATASARVVPVAKLG